jgi:hypothetical protein
VNRELTREMARPVLITNPNPHELAALVRDRRLVVQAPMTLVSPGVYGVVVLATRPIRAHRRTWPLVAAGTAVVVLGGAAVLIGWWETGLPPLCALFLAGAVTLGCVIWRTR